MTQEQVAFQLVVDQSMVSHWERGVAPVARHYYSWLAGLYGVPRAELEEAAAEARDRVKD